MWAQLCDRERGQLASSPQNAGTGQQALWIVILSTDQKERASLGGRGLQRPQERDGGICRERVPSIELLDFAATLWTWIRRTELWLPSTKDKTKSSVLFPDTGAGIE